MISVLLPESTAAPKAPAKPIRSDDSGGPYASQDDPSSKDEFSTFLPETADQAGPERPKADDGLSAGLAAAPENPSEAALVRESDLLAGTAKSAMAELPTTEAETQTTPPKATGETVKVSPEADALAAAQTQAAAEDGSKDPRTRPASEVIEVDPRVRASDRSTTDTAADASRGAATVAVQNADQDRRPASGPLTAEAVGRFSPDSDRASTEVQLDTLQNTPRRDTAETDLAMRANAQGRATMAETSALDRVTVQTVPRDGAGLTTDSLVAITPASSGPSVQAAQGLTPIAPSIPVASPSELSNVILNAVKNGADPQEQLMVQLDPPELGRVTIDFKFDAQGLQQVVVTSENPEALKRLRELHFELTQALREQGLPDTNMSFKEQASDQSNSTWQGSEGQGHSRPSLTPESSNTSVSAARERLQTAPRDRLDLLL